MLDFYAGQAVIEPAMTQRAVPGFPSTVAAVFDHRLFAAMLTALSGKQIAASSDVDGDWPIYEICYRGRRLGFCKGRLGAPACVGFFEEVIAMGAKRIVLLGSCGVLERSIADCGIVIPTAALRDEGTSYHYAPASDSIPVNRHWQAEFREILVSCGYPFTEGITWTTDAFYRETPAAVARMRAKGAVCVEMECAAMQAMCDFRGVDFFQFLYAGDNLDHSDWEPRSLSGLARLTDKQKVGLLALELAAKMEETQCL